MNNCLDKDLQELIDKKVITFEEGLKASSLMTGDVLKIIKINGDIYKGIYLGMTQIGNATSMTLKTQKVWRGKVRDVEEEDKVIQITITEDNVERILVLDVSNRSEMMQEEDPNVQ